MIRAFRRLLFILILSIVWFWFSAIIIMGETVFWRLAFVDNLYTNMGTNPLDTWVTIFWIGELLVEALGFLWVWGILGWAWNRFSENL